MSSSNEDTNSLSKEVDNSINVNIDGDNISIASEALDTLDLPDLTNITAQHWNDLWTGLNCFPNITGTDVPQDHRNQTMTTVTLPPFNATTLLHAASSPNEQTMTTNTAFPKINDMTTASTALPSFNANSWTTLPSNLTTTQPSTTAQPFSTMLLPLQSISTSATTVPRQKISINAFHADREVTAGEAIQYCLKTRTQINVYDDRDIKNAVNQLTQLKKNIKETAHAYLIKDILISSKALTLPDGTPAPTRRIDDLCEIWSQNPTMVQQMWSILVKRYEDMGEWELTFEKEVMDSLNLEYVEEDAMDETLQAASKDLHGNVIKVIHRKKSRIRGNKGCVAKVVTLVKRDIIKQFNRASSNTHGLTITSVNPIITVDGEGKRKYEKRKIKSSTFSTELHVKKSKVCGLLTYSTKLIY